MYNDHGIMPSEIMQALNLAYKQNEQNSRQKTKAKVESFFTTLNRAKLEFMSLEDMPLDVRVVIDKVVTTLKDWQYNLTCLFDTKIENQKTFDIRANLFSAMSLLSECISMLAKLLDSKNCRQLQTYIEQGNDLVADIMNVLSKKSIAIRRYI